MFKIKIVFARRLFFGSVEVMLAPSAFSPIATSVKIEEFENFKWLTDYNNESIKYLEYDRANNRSLKFQF